MNESTLDRILSNLTARKVAVLGDFCVDRYFHIDPSITDRSNETGLPIHQVMQVRAELGGGANVLNSLAALRVGEVYPIGFVGLDGEGFELNRAFDALGFKRDYLHITESRHTPVYLKPLLIRPGQAPEEIQRFDIFPREPLSREQEDALLGQLGPAFDRADALIVADYTEAGKHGVVSPRVREAVADLGRRNPAKPILADSRLHVADFSCVVVKPNRREAVAFLGGRPDAEPTMVLLMQIAQQTVERNRRPVFITLGPEGVLVCSAGRARKIPAYPSENYGPIDIVGAGDAVLAALASSLAAGASLDEAAIVGMLAASITIQQIGRCGTASPDAIRARFREYAALFPDVVTD